MIDKLRNTKIYSYAVLILMYGISHAVGHHNANDGITVPLHYYPEYGVYTATIHVGKEHAQALEAIVDTGSAILVLVADETYCPSCVNALTKGALDPSALGFSSVHKTMPVSYGSAKDIVGEYEAAVHYVKNQANPINMSIYVLKNSNQPTSILGMVQQNLKNDPVTSTPFIVKVTNHFKEHAHLTLVMCGRRGQSYYHIGPIDLPKPVAETKLIPSPFYEMFTSGFYNEQLQGIAKTKHEYGPAIVDTGTGGYIILSPHLYQSLFQYLYKHAGAKNQTINPKFWQQNYCVLRDKVDYNSLPVIKLGIKSLKGEEPSFLTLKPEAYINRAGCDKDYVRLIFTQVTQPNFFSAIRNHNARKTEGKTPEMIIGTALLNRYAVKFAYKPEGIISFYDNTNLCTHHVADVP